MDRQQQLEREYEEARREYRRLKPCFPSAERTEEAFQRFSRAATALDRWVSNEHALETEV